MNDTPSLDTSSVHKVDSTTVSMEATEIIDSKELPILDLAEDKEQKECQTSSSDILEVSEHLPPGTINRENDGMISFVAQDFESKVKNSPKKKQMTKQPSASSSFSSSSSTFRFPTTRQRTISSASVISPALMNELETEANRMSSELESLGINIKRKSYEISDLTCQAADTFEQCLSQSSDQIDANIKSMYQIMAKCEELSIQMRPIEILQREIAETKRLLVMFEKAIDT